MFRKYLFLLALLFVISLNAETITTKDGKAYKNATVFSVKVNGIVISYTDKSNYENLRFINFKNLPENLQKKYHYNKINSDIYDAKHRQWVEKQYQKAQDANIQSEDYVSLVNKVEQQIQNTAMQIQFEARNTLEKGTEGHCWRIYPNGKNVLQGDIILVGVEFGDKGDMWSGYVCPLEENIAANNENLPCYAEQDMAFQILLEKEKKIYAANAKANSSNAQPGSGQSANSQNNSGQNNGQDDNLTKISNDLNKISTIAKAFTGKGGK